MKKMTASVKDKETNEIMNITSEFASRKEFKFNLNRNGYQVIGRITVEDEKETRRSRLYDMGYKI